MVGFRNQHELLGYLVELDDSDSRWRLQSGLQLAEQLRNDARLDPTQPDREYDELGRMLWSLKDDDSIRFFDSANQGPSPRRRQPFASFTMDDVQKFANIEVTTQGRTAVRADRPSLAINIENFDMVVLFNLIEEKIDLLPGNEEDKAEAKSVLRQARETVATVGKTAAAELVTAALRHALGI
jgi:hypothetical protein